MDSDLTKKSTTIFPCEDDFVHLTDADGTRNKTIKTVNIDEKSGSVTAPQST